MTPKLRIAAITDEFSPDLAQALDAMKPIGMTGADFPALTWSNFLVGNLLPVTAGNIIGGSVMVAATYWFVYLRKSKPVDPNSGI